MSAFVVGPNPPFDKLDGSLSIESTPILSSEPQIQDFYETNTVDAARRRIDQDIEKMEGAIRALKSRRNSLAAISRLPPEILSKIFVCCAATYELPQLTMNWVKITHVSRHWRTVAIGCPHLWTMPVFARPRWVEEMLKRSKMAPLVIDARLAHMAGPKYEAIQLAMNHISRARELYLDSSSAWFGKLFSSVPRAAPMLQTLVLSTSTMHSAEPFLDNYSIPPELFSDNSAQLRRLELSHCNINWTSHLLRGLTHLKIHNTTPGTRPSTLLFLDVLEQLPTLTVLDLKDALPHVADGSSTVSYKRRVELRSLTNLHLSGSNYDCSAALRHLSVSSIATLKLYCRSTAVSEADFSSILTFVSGFWEPTANILSAKPPIRSLKIVGDDSTGFSLQAWPTMLSFERLSGGLDLNLPPPIDLGFHWSSTITPGIWNKVIGETCAALPLEQLTSLDVSASQMTEQTWLRRFGKLTHLRSIRAQRMAVHTLLSAMNAEPSTTTGASVPTNSSTRKRSRNRRKIMPPAVYFPSLLHLTIEDTSFDSGYDDEYAELEDLKDCLIQRYERKAEVRKLTLSQCDRLTAEHVDELREIVVDVIWDGLETGFTESDVSTDYHGHHFGFMGDSDIDDHIYDGFDSDDDYSSFPF
ncbi:uncharacterized protein LACBIDRAFT_305207 [Laccaria bicolor S238N-H82]|uniref:Predicted protein n=1 Tax=Laccaria bicolor (strain S238N-H82 / ATCC MYA-4686) TaxID=486041 RepID=B0CTP0_LACBS|nr:uncharacterized protein LACBIDRAFT_305207 [Laccaria bicolor S238N-H82]EDR14527.1 predicted protein [Laccaria bicolor S238N-H82]|eukprot:XP_001875086.1 predicted protein [Laccaria bicolor S238N-H82]